MTEMAVFLLCLIALVDVTHTAKILLLPADHSSHVMFMATAADTLVDKGHEVSVLTHHRHAKELSKHKLKVIFPESKDLHYTEREEMKSLTNNQFSKESATNPITMFRTIIKFYVEWCELILNDEVTMKILKDAQFDLVIVDGFLLCRCQYLIPYKLNIPYMSLTAMTDPWNLRVATLPSIEPVHIQPTTNEMGFFERLKCLAVFVGLVTVFPYLAAHDDLVVKYVPERPAKTIMQLYQDSEMFLVNLDPYILDYPRMSAPHYQFVGGMGCSPAKPLPEDLESFVSGAEDGIVVVSFGSLIKDMPLEVLFRLLDGLGRLTKLRAVMRFAGEIPDGIPANVRLMKWIPQNDLLGHPKTRAFVTHGGNNGQLEATYQGVPQIVFPLFGDQHYNAERTKSRKYGIAMDIFTFKSVELTNGINEVVYSGPYSDNAKRAAEIVHALPNPQETTAFWVDHILRFGGSHLRPSFINMPLYEFLMLDILVFILVLLHIVVYVVYKIIARCCFRRRGSKTKQKDE